MGYANKGVVLDTNMVMAIPSFKIDVITEVRKMAGEGIGIWITENVRRELEELEQSPGSTGISARLGMAILEEGGVRMLPSIQRDTDTELEALAEKGYWVATNDRALRKRVKKLGGSCIFLRQQKYLVRDESAGGA